MHTLQLTAELIVVHHIGKPGYTLSKPGLFILFKKEFGVGETCAQHALVAAYDMFWMFGFEIAYHQKLRQELADKLDTLVGIYGIGLIPTGEKDPFALRRAALSVVRTLVENKLSLNLMQLLEIAEAQFPAGLIAKDTVPKLYDFMLERLKHYLREQGFGPDEIDAVLSLLPTRMDWITPRLKAIQAFRKMPEAESLAAANKRIRNILKQAQREPMEIVNADLLKQDEEKHLARHLALLEEEVMPLIHHEQYTQALKHLASLRPAVDAFFDKVMVMVEDKALRDNRLALLTKLEGLFMRVADISKLQYGER